MSVRGSSPNITALWREEYWVIHHKTSWLLTGRSKSRHRCTLCHTHHVQPWESHPSINQEEPPPIEWSSPAAINIINCVALHECCGLQAVCHGSIKYSDTSYSSPVGHANTTYAVVSDCSYFPSASRSMMILFFLPMWHGISIIGVEVPAAFWTVIAPEIWVGPLKTWIKRVQLSNLSQNWSKMWNVMRFQHLSSESWQSLCATRSVLLRGEKVLLLLRTYHHQWLQWLLLSQYSPTATLLLHWCHTQDFLYSPMNKKHQDHTVLNMDATDIRSHKSLPLKARKQRLEGIRTNTTRAFGIWNFESNTLILTMCKGTWR